MCGIVGYTGRKSAAGILKEGLKKLEYRGYDSAGIAVLSEGVLRVVKRKGRVERLDELAPPPGNTGIGHTRWATHGAPSERNAHPHVYGKFALVHNGIVENAFALREECIARGEEFLSETDSEVIVHLISRAYRGDFLAAVREGTARLSGSYALAVLCTDFPDTVVCARGGSPLVVGRGDGLYCASDIPAIAADGMEIFALREGEFALLKGDELTLYDKDLNRTEGERAQFDPKGEVPDKGGYDFFMAKEMGEIPSVLSRSVVNFRKNRRFSALYKVLCQAEYIHIVACGTAYHSGLCAKYVLEKLCRVPTEACVASEYRYRDPVVKESTLCIAVSQSGETADTLAAAELAKSRGAKLLAVTNVPYSSLTRLADFSVLTQAGREIAVAATKSFCAQLGALYSLAVCRAGGDLADLNHLSLLSEKVLAKSEDVKDWTAYFSGAKSVCFIGRGVDYCAALEGSLKLKEISYLPGEGYPAGELKHGTLALVDYSTPVVAVLTQRALAEKTMNAVHEVYARGAKVFLVTSFPEYARREEVFGAVVIPPCGELFAPALSVIPLQKLAYYTALARGNDPDKPRHLAKAVTVE